MAWLPIPVLLAAILILWAADSQISYELPYLQIGLSFCFSTLASLLIAYLIGRSFMVYGMPGLLLLGCGVLFWGSAGFLAGIATLIRDGYERIDQNTLVTIHNICAWLSALCHLTGAAFSLRWRLTLRASYLWLAISYAVVFGAVGLVVWTVFSGWTPVFFVQGQGGTPVRQFVLGSAIAMFVFTAILLRPISCSRPSFFMYWYSLALLLLADGLFGVMIQSVHGSLLGWTGRGAQFLGGVYMLVAAFMSMREPSAYEIRLELPADNRRYYYGITVAIVIVAAIVRLVFLQELEMRVAFITFYPAVMIAAFYGGMRAGLLAIVLSILLADYFWVGQEGQFSIEESSDWLGIAVFAASGVLISWITETMHHAQARVAVAETEARFVAERKSKEAELQKLNRTLSVIMRSSQIMMRATDEMVYLNEICRIIAEDCEHIMVWIGYAEHDEHKTVRPVAHAGFEKSYLENLNVSWADNDQGRGPTGTCIRTGKPSICRNTLTDPNFKPWREEALKRGYVSSLAFPLLAHDVVFGAIAIYSTQPDHFSEDEIELLAELADDLSFGIAALRLRQEHKQAEKALQRSEARYRSLFETMTEGLMFNEVICDDSGNPCDLRVLEVNQSFEHQTGLKASYIVGHTIMEIFPETKPSRFEIFGKVALTGEPAHFEMWANTLGRCFEMSAFQTEPGRIGVIFFDVTDRKRAAETLQETHRRKDEFLAMLAHELRNPLAPICNAVQVLRKIDRANPTADWGYDVIDRQVQHMARLLDDLLDTARIIQGKIILKNQLINLGDVIACAVESCRPFIESKKHRLAISLSTEPQWLEGDAMRLEQILINLLNNAAKYMKEGGDITLSVAREGDWAMIQVQDAGIGIAPELLPHVFDIFTQADRSLAHSQGGLGLGLNLVQRLAELHGGSVTAASAGLDLGSEFTVRLPLLPAEHVAVVSAGELIPAGSLETIPQLRILVVDDNIDGAESLAVLLRLSGHEVVTVACGTDALACSIDFRPQIVILDIGLPDLDGYEVAQRLREFPETQYAKLIAVTGYGQDEDREHSRMAGFDYHFLKPVDFDAISGILMTVSSSFAPELQP
ncbi:hybrid sensor histidine kinase/response regulator [Methylobacter luteus]|uniref:hybrid sensor histidine kinase/response regulator n=1 Tax=Methylobacter luteus TaxID=415 RepID=UPI0004009C1C|nr:ATP-binding protein [Methylobacter luteus]